MLYYSVYPRWKNRRWRGYKGCGYCRGNRTRKCFHHVRLTKFIIVLIIGAMGNKMALVVKYLTSFISKQDWLRWIWEVTSLKDENHNQYRRIYTAQNKTIFFSIILCPSTVSCHYIWRLILQIIFRCHVLKPSRSEAEFC